MTNEHEITRRDLLAIGGVSLLSAAGVRTAGAAATEDLPWIDAHSHIWTPDTSRFVLQPGMTVDDLAPRSFTDHELMAVARPEGVGRVVLIQHTWFHGFDNSYLIDAWRRHPDQFRVVGMVDDLRPNAGRAMKQLREQGVNGFRIVPRKGIGDWLQTDGMTEMWKTAAETRQPMCCLINPENLPEVDAACRRHPQTPVVIDHFARIGIDGTIRDADLKRLCDLAQHPHVKVKISAYYALGRKQPPHHELIPMIRRLFEAYGAGRLMWASDSPYQLDGDNNYKASISLVRDVIDFVSDDERRQLLRTTAEETFFFV
ncbi:MAG: amidohydrolase family protein [Planctomycetaceae bacterium]|nr:amidohydrolase family protein [Planctomycetaceae bacterium]